MTNEALAWVEPVEAIIDSFRFELFMTNALKHGILVEALAVPVDTETVTNDPDCTVEVGSEDDCGIEVDSGDSGTEVDSGGWGKDCGTEVDSGAECVVEVDSDVKIVAEGMEDVSSESSSLESQKSYSEASNVSQRSDSRLESSLQSVKII